MIADLAIVALAGLFVRRGMRRGLISSLAGLLGFVAATAAAVVAYPALTPAVARRSGLSSGTAALVAAIGIFALVTLAFWVAGRYLSRALRWSKWGAIDAAGGGALAAAWALSWIAVLLLALTALPSSHRVSQELERSVLAKAISEEAPGVAAAVTRADVRALLARLLSYE